MAEIKSEKEAIQLTIDRYQAVIDGKYPNYSSAKTNMQPTDWSNKCPLCEWSKRCINCPWMEYESKACIGNYKNKIPQENIVRLKRWLAK